MEILKYLDLRRYFALKKSEVSECENQTEKSRLEVLSCVLNEERISCIYSNRNRLAFYNLE